MSLGDSVWKAPNRQLSTFSFSPTLKEKLLSNGFTILQDLRDFRPLELSKEIGVTPKQALEIFKTIELDLQNLPNIDDYSNMKDNDIVVNRSVINGQTAFSKLEAEVTSKKIFTMSKDLDNMLGGGVSTGKVIEFCGLPGIGKTQIGMQLVVNAHIPYIPDILDGADGHAIYIDTEGSFMAARVGEIADSLVELLATFQLPKQITSQYILEHIYYYRLHDCIEQIALVNILPSFLKEHPEVRIIVFDSVSFLFRYDFTDMSTRTRILQNMASQLNTIASEFNVAVVLINQVTTRFEGERSTLVPALGETWLHAASMRVMLFWHEGKRYANLVKSPTSANKTVPFIIVPSGIRTYEEDNE